MSTTSTKQKSCDHNCFACVYSDCLFDGVTDEERELQDRTDERLIERKLEGSAVIHTGKPGRPRKIRDEEAVKEAKRARMRQYYWAHREEKLAKQKAYYKEHREECAAYFREYHRKNRKKLNASRLAKYHENMDTTEFVEKERLRAHERYRKRKEKLVNGLNGKE